MRKESLSSLFNLNPSRKNMKDVLGPGSCIKDVS